MFHLTAVCAGEGTTCFPSIFQLQGLQAKARQLLSDEAAGSGSDNPWDCLICARQSGILHSTERPDLGDRLMSMRRGSDPGDSNGDCETLNLH